MIGRKADHTCGSACRLQTEKLGALRPLLGGIRHQGRKIIGKYEVFLVIRIFVPVYTRIGRTQIALGIVGGLHGIGKLLRLSEPRSFGTMRGNKDPFAGQGVISAVRMGGYVELCHYLLLRYFFSRIHTSLPVGYMQSKILRKLRAMLCVVTVGIVLLPVVGIGRHLIQSLFSLPAQFLLSLGRIGIALNNISGTARSKLIGKLSAYGL